jgi:ubiquinone/menaquinone biosynthesis C-methylase UbiE
VVFCPKTRPEQETGKKNDFLTRLRKETPAMSQQENFHWEHPSTYVVQDRSNEEELARLQIQDHMLTVGMGGVLPEQPDPSVFQRVLDVGCGTGGWLIETAKTYPGMSLLIGIDVSTRMLDYARRQAEANGVSDRVEFHQMDALRMLEFPTSFFDLVNHRSAQSWLRTWDWYKLLQEYQRVCRPEGVIRITEVDFAVESTSSAVNQLNHLFVRAFHQSGHYFTPQGDGITSQIARLLQQHGVLDVQTRACMLEQRTGTPEGQSFYDDMRLVYRTAVPFLQKWIRLPDDYQEIYQQALSDMQQPGFVGKIGLLTAWGKVPARQENLTDSPR